MAAAAAGRAEHGWQSGAAPSQRLLSAGLSVPSLSRLTSLLKPLAVTKNKPTSTPTDPPPPMLHATFHPRPCPKLPLSFHPPPCDAYTQTRGSDCLRGHAPNIRAREGKRKKTKKKSSGKEQKLESCAWLMIFIRVGDVRRR